MLGSVYIDVGPGATLILIPQHSAPYFYACMRQRGIIWFCLFYISIIISFIIFITYSIMRSTHHKKILLPRWIVIALCPDAHLVILG